jgi:hypothetical protein
MCSTVVVEPAHECVKVVEVSVSRNQFTSGCVVQVTTVPRAGVERFNEAEVFVLKGTQGVVLASAVGVGLFFDGFDFVEDFATGVDNVKVGAPIDFGVTGAIEVIVQVFHCNNPPKVVDLCGISTTIILYTLWCGKSTGFEAFLFFQSRVLSSPINPAISNATPISAQGPKRNAGSMAMRIAPRMIRIQLMLRLRLSAITSSLNL